MYHTYTKKGENISNNKAIKNYDPLQENNTNGNYSIVSRKIACQQNICLAHMHSTNNMENVGKLDNPIIRSCIARNCFHVNILLLWFRYHTKSLLNFLPNTIISHDYNKLWYNDILLIMILSQYPSHYQVVLIFFLAIMIVWIYRYLDVLIFYPEPNSTVLYHWKSTALWAKVVFLFA